MTHLPERNTDQLLRVGVLRHQTSSFPGRTLTRTMCRCFQDCHACGGREGRMTGDVIGCRTAYNATSDDDDVTRRLSTGRHDSGVTDFSIQPVVFEWQNWRADMLLMKKRDPRHGNVLLEKCKQEGSRKINWTETSGDHRSCLKAASITSFFTISCYFPLVD